MAQGTGAQGTNAHILMHLIEENITVYCPISVHVLFSFKRLALHCLGCRVWKGWGGGG